MMEAKGFLVLLVFGLLSTALGWQHYCSPQLVPSNQHPITCKNTTSCSEITCSARVSHQDLRLSVNIDQGQHPMTAYVTLSVLKLGFDWSASFKDGENIEIPGFPLKIEGFPVGENGVSRLQISLKKENGSINFKIDLLAWSEVKETPHQTTLIEGKIPSVLGPKIPSLSGGDKRISPHAPAGNYYKKFKRLPKVSKILIITSVFAFLILVFLATLYYCKRKKATTADQVKGKPQSYDEAKAPSTKTNVPMRPLINEV